MSASRPTLTDAQREAIYTLRKQGKSGTEIQERCARGTQGLPPFSVSATHARTVANRIAADRGELYSTRIGEVPDSEALDLLIARLFGLSEREIQRQESLQKRGRMDAAQVGKLAGTLEKLHRLQEKRASGVPERPRGGEGETVPETEAEPTLAEKLIAEGAAQTVPDDDASAAIGDVKLGTQGGTFARADRRPAESAH